MRPVGGRSKTLKVTEVPETLPPPYDGHTPHTRRYLAREAAKNGCDGTDYTRSYTASSFVPYYAQRLSWASAGGVADGILASTSKASRDRLRSRAAGQQ